MNIIFCYDYGFRQKPGNKFMIVKQLPIVSQD
jgi:hypothetical protein